MPSIATVQSYEAVYIIDPDLGEEQISTITTRYRQVVETAGGTVEKVDVWERRRLAYAVKGRTDGIYVIMHFAGTATVEAELRRIFQISEDQIRSLIVKKEDSADALPPGQPDASQAPVAAPAPAAAPIAEAPAPVTEEETPAPLVAEHDVPAAEAETTETATNEAVTTDAAPALAAEQTPAE